MSTIFRRANVLTPLFRIQNRICVSCSRRGILSDAFACREQWAHRLQTPALQKVDIASFAMRLQEKLDKEGSAKAIDMDIFANKIEHLEVMQLDFAQNLLQRFRGTPETVHCTDATSYAFIRTLLQMEQTERLLMMLQDKIKYGLFLDPYSACMCMDYFIKRKMFQDAATIAYDLMLAEDFGTPLSRALAWYSCHQHWQNPPPPAEAGDEAAPDDEEETLVKVKFIRNPWYDDHWDITDDQQKLGKTFWSLTQTCDGTLTCSYHLIGLGLYGKPEKALQWLEKLVEESDTRNLASIAVTTFAESLENIVTKEPPAETKEPGEMTLDDVKPFITEEQKQQYIERFQKLQSRLSDQGQIIEYDLGAHLHEHVNKVIAEHEKVETDAHADMFTQWEDLRQQEIDAQLEEMRIQQKKLEIAKRIHELTQREEKLRYFEQEEKIRLGISRIPNHYPIETVQEEEQFVAAPSERGKGY